MAERGMRFGVFPGAVGMSWPEMAGFWRYAEEAGYDTIWLPDHFYAGVGDPAAGCFEAWSMLAAGAAVTHRIRFGTMVSGNTYRHPAVLANMAATIDHISGGRLILGIGAGWMQVEHDGYGIPLPPPRERLDRLDEALWVLRRLFTEPRANFGGRYYQLNDALCEPKPIQRPYPPLLVGGGGERRTLRVVARHADEWNGEVSPSQMARKIGILREHCHEIGRDPDEIGISVLLRTEAEGEGMYDRMVQLGNPLLALERQRLIDEGVSSAELEDRLRASIWEQFLSLDEERAVDQLCQYAAVGVRHFIVIRRPPFDYALMDRFLERIAPRVKP